ncbi:hypothetical protein ACFQ1A_29425, partial [Massilia pinisoli]|uniref:hypothetical protein n=1 Tax=Massilia pinisoli TaxID=1772194 RepID=UPI0036351C85
MQLLYAWIDNYINIHQQGFNFSAEYEIVFDISSKELRIDINENYIDNFFGDKFSNITAIIGENGVGKSSILKFKDLGFYIVKYRNEILLIFQKDNFKSIAIKSDLVIRKKKGGNRSSDLFKDVMFLNYAYNYEASINLVRNYHSFYDKYIADTFEMHDISTDWILAHNYFVAPHEETH